MLGLLQHVVQRSLTDPAGVLAAEWEEVQEEVLTEHKTSSGSKSGAGATLQASSQLQGEAAGGQKADGGKAGGSGKVSLGLVLVC